jgi:hypothetical protein
MDGFQRYGGSRDIVFLGMEEGRDGFAGPRTQMHQDPRRAASYIGVFLLLHETRHGMHNVRIKETREAENVFRAPRRILVFLEIIDQECNGYPVGGPGFDEGLGRAAADPGIKIALGLGDFPHQLGGPQAAAPEGFET